MVSWLGVYITWGYDKPKYENRQPAVGDLICYWNGGIFVGGMCS